MDKLITEEKVKELMQRLVINLHRPENHNQQRRLLGCLEGLLVLVGKLQPGEPLPYKERTETYKWFGKTKTRTYTEGYKQMILGCVHEYLFTDNK